MSGRVSRPEGASFAVPVVSEEADRAARSRLAELERRYERDARRALQSAPRERGVPDDPGIMGVVLSDKLPRTPPVGVIADAAAWRDRNASAGRLPPVTVVLSGTAGCGKSSAGAAFAARIDGGLYVTAADVGALSDSDWSGNAELRRRWETAPFLFVDDLGVEWSRHSARRIMTLQHLRHNRALFTVYSTNLNYDQFDKGFLNTTDPNVRDRIMSRLDVGQAKGGDPNADGFPWWWEIKVDGDFRDHRVNVRKKYPEMRWVFSRRSWALIGEYSP